MVVLYQIVASTHNHFNMFIDWYCQLHHTEWLLYNEFIYFTTESSQPSLLCSPVNVTNNWLIVLFICFCIKLNIFQSYLSILPGLSASHFYIRYKISTIAPILINPNCTGVGGGLEVSPSTKFCRARKTAVLSATPLHDLFSLKSYAYFDTKFATYRTLPLRSHIRSFVSFRFRLFYFSTVTCNHDLL